MQGFQCLDILAEWKTPQKIHFYVRILCCFLEMFIKSVPQLVNLLANATYSPLSFKISSLNVLSHNPHTQRTGGGDDQKRKGETPSCQRNPFLLKWGGEQI